MYDIIIVGAGIAGLTAAIYARRAEKKVLVLEAVSYGGQIINTMEIENYPGMPGVSGPDLAKSLYEQAMALGAEVEFERVISVRRDEEYLMVGTEEENYHARAVILATGSEYRKLGLEHEDALVGKGVSYCATCDGRFYQGKDVMVNGGGNTALYDAEYLAGVCRKVYLVHRREQFRGDIALVERVKKLANVEMILEATVEELIVQDGRLGAVKVARMDKPATTIEVEGLFVAIGHTPSVEAFAGLVEQDEDGYVLADEDCKTSASGVFVAGDVRRKGLRQLVTAAADGAAAATSALDFLGNL